MTFASGSLVKVRGREWVVLPGSQDHLLLLRPLGGTDAETAGVLPALEPVKSAEFDLPDPTLLGDYRSGRLLREAVRLGFRASAGPFRSFGRLAVAPRPYQVVPLLMALRLDPVRLLIADDVGIGKTVEAALIARELLDRREVKRLAVLCPPHLAGQWQRELAEKFHIEAEPVLPGTVRRLERSCAQSESLFERYPFVIVSMDFIKSDRRRDDFIRTCPELVIVDEAHACASGLAGKSSHQRHQLLADLSRSPNRHLVLVTGTPHSGNEEAFRSLVALLDPAFAALPLDLSGDANATHRRRLAQHFVQRRRRDVVDFGADTIFPEREPAEEVTYTLSPEYRAFYRKILRFAREKVHDARRGGDRLRERISYWSALALLRCLFSSPASAAATLSSRASTADATTPEQADEVGRRVTLDDAGDDEGFEAIDVPPGADQEDEATAPGSPQKRRLKDLEREARKLEGAPDRKLAEAAKSVRKLVADGFNPIVFCRYIPTAGYVADKLREVLPADVTVQCVTGLLPPEDREARVAELGKAARRVLVATDCLSEGINLQNRFDAVFHYDLSWNPTRHEQREGRVDRYGQRRPKVRVVTCYGADNDVDPVVLKVLLRKHQVIRRQLGVSIPVPGGEELIARALLEGLLNEGQEQQVLDGLEDFVTPRTADLSRAWDEAGARESRSRTLFAQHAIKLDEVVSELAAAEKATGGGVDVSRFVEEALGACGAAVGRKPAGRLAIDLADTSTALRDLLGAEKKGLVATFELPERDGETLLVRTHPFVEGLASHLLDRALDPASGEGPAPARRCGVIRTAGVARRTTLLLLRYRFHIERGFGDAQDEPLLAEDCGLLAFEGAPESAAWLDPDRAEALLALLPDENPKPDVATEALRRVLGGFPSLAPCIEQSALERGESLAQAHSRVRQSLKARGAGTARARVLPQLPVDVLGVYLYLPAVAGGARG